MGALARRSCGELILFAAAAGCLAAARLAVVALPFRALAVLVGRRAQERLPDDSPAHRRRLEQIAWAIAAAARRLPWRCKCLEQAVAARWLLRGSGIPSTLHLGVARRRAGAAGVVDAHAWLRSGSFVVTGATDENFAIVASFPHGEPS